MTKGLQDLKDRQVSDAICSMETGTHIVRLSSLLLLLAFEPHPVNPADPVILSEN
jgi:hypothetical protein